MKIRALKTSILIINTILILLAAGMVFLFGFTFYWAYAFNENFRIELWDLSDYVNDIPFKLRFLVMAFLILENAILMYIFYKIRTILLQMNESGPFNHTITKQLKSVSNWVPIFIGIRVLHIFLKAAIQKGQFTLSLSMSTLYILLLICMIFVLIEVFKYGTEIIEEQKLTV